MAQRFPILVAGALWLVACVGQTGENSFNPCVGVTYEEVADDDDSLGFTADHVLDLLPAYDTVEWDSLTLGETSDTLSIELTLEGPVEIADYSDALETCSYLGMRVLMIPVTADIVVGEGAVVGQGPASVVAPSLEPSEINLHSGWELEAELSGTYQDHFDTWWEERQQSHPEATDWLLETVAVIPFGTFEQMQLDIEALYESSEFGAAEALWRGTVTSSEQE